MSHSQAQSHPDEVLNVHIVLSFRPPRSCTPGLVLTEGWKVHLLALTIASNFATSCFLGMKSDLIRQKFHELHSAGLPYSEITKQLGISPRTASNWVQEMGLPRRKGGPRRKRWIPGTKPKIV
jgi:hypothetical protein